jgi:hypothetical protein
LGPGNDATPHFTVLKTMPGLEFSKAPAAMNLPVDFDSATENAQSQHRES